jgi:hypothetical protein
MNSFKTIFSFPRVIKIFDPTDALGESSIRKVPELGMLCNSPIRALHRLPQVLIMIGFARSGSPLIAIFRLYLADVIMILHHKNKIESIINLMQEELRFQFQREVRRGNNR